MALSFYSMKWSQAPAVHLSVNAERDDLVRSFLPTQGIWHYAAHDGTHVYGFYDVKDGMVNDQLNLRLGRHAQLAVDISPDTRQVMHVSVVVPRIDVGFLPGDMDIFTALEPWGLFHHLIKTEHPEIAQEMQREDKQFVVFVPTTSRTMMQMSFDVRRYIVEFPTLEVAHNYHALCLPGQQAQRGDPELRTMSGNTLRVIDWEEHTFDPSLLGPRTVPSVSPQKFKRTNLPYHVILKLQVSPRFSVNVNALAVTDNGIIYNLGVDLPR